MATTTWSNGQTRAIASSAQVSSMFRAPQVSSLVVTCRVPVLSLPALAPTLNNFQFSHDFHFQCARQTEVGQKETIWQVFAKKLGSRRRYLRTRERRKRSSLALSALKESGTVCSEVGSKSWRPQGLPSHFKNDKVRFIVLVGKLSSLLVSVHRTGSRRILKLRNEHFLM